MTLHDPERRPAGVSTAAAAADAGANSGPASEGLTTETSGVHPSTLGPARLGRRPTQTRWVLLVAIVTGAGLLTMLFAFGLSRDPSAIGSPLVGRRAPNFTLRTLDGSGVIRLSTLRGQVVLINFWASWCAACREEHPNLEAAWERYRDQGVVLLGVDFQDSTQSALAFMRDMGGDWPVLGDPGGRTALDFGVSGVPETFFIGRDGVIDLKRVGPSSYELLSDEIQRLLSRTG